MMNKLRRENSDLFKPELDDLDDDEEEDDEDDERHSASTRNSMRERSGGNPVLDSTDEDLIIGDNSFGSESIMKAERMLFRYAAKSRLFVFATAIVSSLIIGTPFDTSTSLISQMEYIPYALQCPANWDGAYYTRIALKGYEYEESHAFFPLFAIISRIIGKNFILGWLSNNDALSIAIGGAFWNNILFIVTAIVLFRLGCIVLNDDKLAMRAALLFCYNPASIFFSVAYSESMFTLLSFTGMYFLISPRRNFSAVNFQSRLAATVFFALATLTRSNGALFGLFSIWAAYNSFMASTRDRRSLIKATFELGAVGLIHFTALLSVLGYGWYLYCWDNPNKRPWCTNWIPNIYTYVQEKYWNIGLFRYYEKKQLPNFLLALPSLFLSFEAIIHFGFRKRIVPWPFLVHALVLLLVAVPFMHIQVYTRFIASSSPLFYWYCAEITRWKSAPSYFVCLYFAFYTMLGTAMFCSYFPWT